MIIRIAAFLALSAQAWAQYEGISTTTDGSLVIFATKLRQKNTEQPAWGKLFIAGGSGMRPFLIRNRDEIPGGTNGYDLRSGILSRDARWLAVTGASECLSSSGICQSRDENITTIYDATGSERLTIAGTVVFSRNGRWLASTSHDATGSQIRVIDLNTLTSRDLVRQSGSLVANTVSDDGAVLVSGAFGGVYLYRPDGTPERIVPNAGNGLMSADGARIAYEQQGRIYLRFDGTTRELGDGRLRAMSDSGEVILLERGGQLWTTSQITQDPSGIQNATVSGDGSTVCYTNGAGALIRIATDGSRRSELISAIAVPSIQRYFVPLPSRALVTPGEPVHIRWSSPVDPALRPDVFVADWPAPVLDSQAREFTFQIPWDVPVNRSLQIRVSLNAPHPTWRTEWPLEAQTTAIYPRVAAAIHENFSELVSRQNPARPGELLHLYALGMGAVASTPVTGEPAREPVPLIESPRCTDGSTILYAGLAPGLIGYYQIDIRLPQAARTIHRLECNRLTEEIPIAAP